MTLDDIGLTTIRGETTTFGAYADKVVMVVNVASRCGLAPQYEKLEALQKRYADQGFTVLGFDIAADRRAAVEAAGVAFVPSLTEVLRRADALVFSLPFARDVEAVVTAEGGLLARSDRKVVVIDTSTSDPGTTRRLAARLAGRRFDPAHRTSDRQPGR